MRILISSLLELARCKLRKLTHYDLKGDWQMHERAVRQDIREAWWNLWERGTMAMSEQIERDKLYLRCTPENLLRGARIVASKAYLRNNPLWKLVSDVTLHGSSYSIAICEDLGWNPHAKALDPLPEPRP